MQTLALQLDRWDRYVDPLSKSSVHLRDTALPVKGVKGQARNEELIVEDFDEDEVCGEDLQQATTDEPDQPLLTSKDNLVKVSPSPALYCWRTPLPLTYLLANSLTFV